VKVRASAQRDERSWLANYLLESVRDQARANLRSASTRRIEAQSPTKRCRVIGACRFK
jgi:hypothetical protein